MVEKYKGITDFLDTALPKEELAAALKVLREFKSKESSEEWLSIEFAAWSKLEQLEEFLAHIVEGAPLAEDTLRRHDPVHKAGNK